MDGQNGSHGVSSIATNGLAPFRNEVPGNSAQHPCHPVTPSPSGLARVWLRGWDRKVC